MVRGGGAPRDKPYVDRVTLEGKHTAQVKLRVNISNPVKTKDFQFGLQPTPDCPCIVSFFGSQNATTMSLFGQGFPVIQDILPFPSNRLTSMTPDR